MQTRFRNPRSRRESMGGRRGRRKVRRGAVRTRRRGRGERAGGSGRRKMRRRRRRSTAMLCSVSAWPGRDTLPVFRRASRWVVLCDGVRRDAVRCLRVVELLEALPGADEILATRDALRRKENLSLRCAPKSITRSRLPSVCRLYLLCVRGVDLARCVLPHVTQRGVWNAPC
eukprot:3360188-Rhodomonas_salina.1